MIVPSTSTYSKSGSADTASKIRWNTSLSAQRLNRLKTLFQEPKPGGRSRHGPPTRTFQSTASRNSRLSLAVTPQLRDQSPTQMRNDKAFRAHCKPPKRKLESLFARFVNPNCQQGLEQVRPRLNHKGRFGCSNLLLERLIHALDGSEVLPSQTIRL